MQCHPTDTATRYKAARHIGALRSAIHSLDAYYRGEMQAHETSLTSFTSPHNPMFPYPSCFTSLDNSTKKSFTYTSHPMDDKLVFFGELLDDGDNICIKFVREYSPDAHAFCASKGFAPALRGFEKLSEGWYMVIMNRIPSDYVKFGNLPKFMDDTWRALSDDIRHHVCRLHSANLIHGNLCDTNIMVKRTNNGNLFLLVDFNWSGVRGVVRYPMNINTPGIWWPEGACDGELITAKMIWKSLIIYSLSCYSLSGFLSYESYFNLYNPPDVRPRAQRLRHQVKRSARRRRVRTGRRTNG